MLFLFIAFFSSFVNFLRDSTIAQLFSESTDVYFGNFKIFMCMGILAACM